MIDWAEWAAANAHNCPVCREIYAGRDPQEDPPCETCRVDLIEENRDAAQIYGMCKRQVITAGEGNEIIDLNYAAIKIMMDLYGVEKQKECFEKVTKTFHHFLNREKAEGI